MWAWVGVSIVGLHAVCGPELVRAQPPRPQPAFGQKAAPRPGTAAPGQVPGTPKAPAAAAPAENVDPKTGLPIGYEPPPTTPDLLKLEAPLLDEETVAKYKKLLGKYKSLVRGCELTKADKEIIDQGLQYRLYVMTLPENVRNLHELRSEIVAQDLRQAATGKQFTKADQIREFRKYFLTQLVKYVEPMLKNNFYVRLHAVTLLGELNLTDEDADKQLKMETFYPACELLIKVLADPEQPQPIKIAAARSIIRLVRFSVVPVELRHRITNTILAELGKPDTHFWYQMRLVEALATLDTPLDLQTRKPLVVATLLGIVRDPQRDFRVRAEAVRALGRVPLDPQVDISAMIRDIGQFSLDLTKAAQQAPTAPHWKSCFFDLYLGFQAMNDSDKDATGANRGGLLNNKAASSAAQPLYKLLIGIVNSVLNGDAIKAAELQALESWTQQNKPPVAQAPAAGTPAGTATNTSQSTGSNR